jgi:hypothetical protein
MNVIVKYSLPALAVLLLILFYLGLPDLRSCSLNGDDRRRHDKIDLAIIAAICVVYGCIGFYKLGNTESPQTFVNMEQHTAVIELGEGNVDKMMLYTGIGIGSYEFEYAADGENYTSLVTFTKSHAEVLKWCDSEFDGSLSGGSVRITGTGNVWLGEVVFLDAEGNIIPVTSTETGLVDEQSLCPDKQNYMNSSYFDEIYHARTAWEHLNGIYPYEITHPPLGKIIISIGISLFGMTPFGWRFSGTLFGVLMLPIMYVFLKKLFGGKLVPTAGTIVFAADFMHFTQTRIATIDTYAVFFILLMYLFMYLFFDTGELKYLALSGITFGLGAASKWTCIYAGGGLAVIWLWYWVRNSRLGFDKFLKNCGFCLIFFVAIPCLIYYLAYIPYGIASGYTVFSGDYTRMVLNNQSYMFNYHTGVVATHPYSSKWYQWILDIRPILYYLEYFSDGTRSSFGAFVNPFLCWGGLLALFVLGYLAIARKDAKAKFIIIGYLAQLLPWVLVSRLTFEYHYFPCTVFLVLALGYIFSIFEKNVKRYKLYVYGFAVGCVGLFVLFYPALSGAVVNNTMASKLLGWLPTWPF